MQILIALCELGISPDDARFVKNGNSLLDYLMTYAKSGGFRHTYSEKAPSPMASEQGLYALAAVARFAEGKSSLYRMKGEGVLTGSPDTGASGLPGKHADVRLPELRFPGKNFSDITGHEAKTAIEALAARGIINGKTADSFLPDETMTRAEFAAITVRGLGLPEKANAVFDDVAPGDWFAPYVGAAHAYGIVTGVSAGLFSPDGTLSREEAAVMIARSAALCGMNTTVDTFTARNLLAGFTDYVRASDWAVSSLAFCCKEGILSDEQLELKPKEPVTRAEIAQMLFHMLEKADLL